MRCALLSTPSPVSGPAGPEPPGFAALIRLTALVCAVVHAAFLIVFAIVGAPVMAAVNVLSVAVHATAVLIIRPGVHRTTAVASAFVGTEVVAHAVLATIILGWGTGFHLLMIPSVPVALLNHRLSTITKGMLAAFATGVYLVLAEYSSRYAPIEILHPAVIHGLYIMNIVTVFGVLSLLSLYYFGLVLRAQAELRDMAATDPLTGAMNRRHLHEVATREWARSRRSHSSISVLMCDIDHFKQINDTHGHEGGDEVLRTVSEEIIASVRSVDSVCRWGGEEFLILLPDTDLIGALVLAERIRWRVRTAVVPTRNGPTTITLTLGAATLREDESFESLVARADAALYQGKLAGRDRVASDIQRADTPPHTAPQARP